MRRKRPRIGPLYSPPPFQARNVRAPQWFWSACRPVMASMTAIGYSAALGHVLEPKQRHVRGKGGKWHKGSHWLPEIWVTVTPSPEGTMLLLKTPTVAYWASDRVASRRTFDSVNPSGWAASKP